MNDEDEEPVDWEPKLSRHWSRYFVSDCMGTFIATIMSDCVFFYLSQESYINLELSGNLFLSIGIAMSYFIALLICRDAGINCVFTIMMAMVGAKRWKMVPLIFLGQLVGGVCGHSVVYYIINGDQYEKDDKLASVFGIFIPDEQIDNKRCFVSSIIYVILLIFALFPVFTPEMNKGNKLSHVSAMMIVGLLIFSLIVVSMELGVQNNPTLFFTAFLFMSMAGFPSEVFHQHDNYWWVAIVGPIVGIIVALLLYGPIQVVIWNEPKNWKKGYLKMIEPQDRTQ